MSTLKVLLVVSIAVWAVQSASVREGIKNENFLDDFGRVDRDGVNPLAEKTEIISNIIADRKFNNLKKKSLIRDTTGSSKAIACDQLDAAIIQEIRGYQPTVDAIIDYVTSGEHKGVTYNILQNFVDTFGPRLVS